MNAYPLRILVVLAALALLPPAAAQAQELPPLNLNPDASFTATPTEGTAPLVVAFEDTSTDLDGDEITAWSWDFDDGHTSTETDPSHTFEAAGTYTVTLTVTDARGGTGSDTETITVSEPPNQAPTASFTANPASGTAPLDVTFNAGASSDPDGSISSYAWDFGDGGTPGTGVNPEHIYTTPGTFDVTLTVTDDDGATGTATATITVSAPNQAPTASFTATPASGTAPLDVTFDAADSADPDGTIATYAWDFGDQTTGTGAQPPPHRYAGPGKYEVMLTVTDDDGATATATRQVTVLPPPPPDDTTPNSDDTPPSGDNPPVGGGFTPPTLQALLTGTLEGAPGPCAVRMRTDFSLIACGGNAPSGLALRTYVVNARLTPLVTTVSAAEALPAKVRKAGRTPYKPQRVTVPAGEARPVTLQPPKKLRAALKTALKRRATITRKPLVMLKAPGVPPTSVTHVVKLRRKKSGR